jgi:tetratricopeptide (TPR) repeat protein
MKRPEVEIRANVPAGHLRIAVEKDPSSLAFVGLAHSILQGGDAEEAARLCKQGLAHHPDHSTGHLVLGLALERSGLPEDALRAFRQVIELDPGNRLAKQRLGEAYRKGIRSPDSSAPPTLRTVPAAEPEEEGELNLGEEIAFFTYSMAEVYEKQGFFEKALSIYQRVLSLQPEREDVRDRIRDLRRRMSAS